MITQEFISELATRLQTTETNITREYFQNLFLSYFYQKKGTENIVFKGGTALRIVFRSPRFSEDLDFSAINEGVITVEDINGFIDNTIENLRNEGVIVTKEVNLGTKGETAGGYRATIKVEMLNLKSEIGIEISFRSPEDTQSNSTLIDNPFIPPYIIHHLKEGKLVEEKIKALISRKKGRDFFDLYFILHNTELVRFMPRTPNLKNQLIELTEEQGSLEEELKIFLPINYQSFIKNFKNRLKREIETHVSN